MLSEFPYSLANGEMSVCYRMLFTFPYTLAYGESVRFFSLPPQASEKKNLRKRVLASASCSVLSKNKSRLAGIFNSERFAARAPRIETSIKQERLKRTVFPKGVNGSQGQRPPVPCGSEGKPDFPLQVRPNSFFVCFPVTLFSKKEFAFGRINKSRLAGQSLSCTA